MDFPTYKVTERTYRYGVRIPDSNFFDYLVSTYDLIVDKDGKISPYDTLRITKIVPTEGSSRLQGSNRSRI